ncbi:unnamed protein product, partial [Prorocentrum cordatum]
MADERRQGARPDAWSYSVQPHFEMQPGWEQQSAEYHWGEQQGMSQPWMQGLQPGSNTMTAAMATLQQLMPQQGAMQQAQVYYAATMPSPTDRSQQPLASDVSASTLAAAARALAQVESAEQEFVAQQRQMEQHFRAAEAAQRKLQDAKTYLSGMAACMQAAGLHSGSRTELPAAFAGASPPHLSYSWSAEQEYKLGARALSAATAPSAAGGHADSTVHGWPGAVAARQSGTGAGAAAATLAAEVEAAPAPEAEPAAGLEEEEGGAEGGVGQDIQKAVAAFLMGDGCSFEDEDEDEDQQQQQQQQRQPPQQGGPAEPAQAESLPSTAPPASSSPAAWNPSGLEEPHASRSPLAAPAVAAGARSPQVEGRRPQPTHPDPRASEGDEADPLEQLKAMLHAGQLDPSLLADHVAARFGAHFMRPDARADQGDGDGPFEELVGMLHAGQLDPCVLAEHVNARFGPCVQAASRPRWAPQAGGRPHAAPSDAGARHPDAREQDEAAAAGGDADSINAVVLEMVRQGQLSHDWLLAEINERIPVTYRLVPAHAPPPPPPAQPGPPAATAAGQGKARRAEVAPARGDASGTSALARKPLPAGLVAGSPPPVGAAGGSPAAPPAVRRSVGAQGTAQPTMADGGDSRGDSEVARRSGADRLLHEMGQEGATTVMLGNLPRHVTQGQLLDKLAETGFRGTWDFLHVPSTFGTGVGKGYAFINF